jgi:SAM-dependent methyltransferase
MSNASNESARATWDERPVGSQRSRAARGSREFFAEVTNYRYGYETPWIASVFGFSEMTDKRVLEIGVGLGIDACEMVRNGARYTGLDITAAHLELAGSNLRQQFGRLSDFEQRVRLIEGDLLDTSFSEPFAHVYSFGVLHHIAHEEAYLARIRDILDDGGTLHLGLYSKYSFFNAYLVATWIAKNRRRSPLGNWRAHIAEGSPIDRPVVIRIRSRREVERLLEGAGFQIVSYRKRGFVQNNIPVLGKHLAPNGAVLTACGSILGWYHCISCKKA